MSLVLSNAFLDEVSAKVRSKPVPWEGYQRAGLLTSEELALIKRIDRQSRAKIDSILLTDGLAYATLYLNLLKKLVRLDTTQYILVMIGDTLIDHDERLALFTQAVESDPELPYGPLIRALDAQDEFVRLKSCQILATLLSSESTTLQSHQLRPYLTTIASVSQGTSDNGKEIGVQCLEALLPRPECRKAVWEMPGVLAGLVEILKSKANPQMNYQVGFCLWLLSFDRDIAREINSKYDIIPLLTDIAQAAVKEKVIRVIVATFRNLVAKAPAENLPAMLVAKLLPFVKNLAGRKWSDEEIMEDIIFLRDELTTNFESLTTYDEYTSELSSGHLSWSPVHDSDTFWKENANKLNDRDYEQLKILVGLLKGSNDPVVLAVAAHDIGKYVKYCDRGKKAVTDLGGKTRVMELMTADNADVRYQALMAVQLLISHPWKS